MIKVDRIIVAGIGLLGLIGMGVGIHIVLITLMFSIFILSSLIIQKLTDGVLILVFTCATCLFVLYIISHIIIYSKHLYNALSKFDFFKPVQSKNGLYVFNNKWYTDLSNYNINPNNKKNMNIPLNNYILKIMHNLSKYLCQILINFNINYIQMIKIWLEWLGSFVYLIIHNKNSILLCIIVDDSYDFIDNNSNSILKGYYTTEVDSINQNNNTSNQYTSNSSPPSLTHSETDSETGSETNHVNNNNLPTQPVNLDNIEFYNPNQQNSSDSEVSTVGQWEQNISDTDRSLSEDWDSSSTSSSNNSSSSSSSSDNGSYNGSDNGSYNGSDSGSDMGQNPSSRTTEAEPSKKRKSDWQDSSDKATEAESNKRRKNDWQELSDKTKEAELSKKHKSDRQDSSDITSETDPGDFGWGGGGDD